jgi:hypothetical protein
MTSQALSDWCKHEIRHSPQPRFVSGDHDSGKQKSPDNDVLLKNGSSGTSHEAKKG